MKRVVHLVGKKDEMFEAVFHAQQQLPEHEVIVLDLDQADPEKVIEEIFQADSVAVWT